MIPLDYCSRTEHSLIYYSEDWKQLGYLLEAPCEFLRSMECHWTQEPVTFDWILTKPATAIIDHYASQTASATRLSTLVKQSGKDVSLDDLKVREPLFDPKQVHDPFRQTQYFQVLAAALQKWIPGNMRPCFLLEYAVSTGVMNILVVPPPKSDVDPDYTPNLTPATLGVVPGSEVGGLSVAHLHVDLHEASTTTLAALGSPCPEKKFASATPKDFVPAGPRLRAKFIIDCLVSRCFLCNYLAAPGNAPLLPPVSMTNEGGTICLPTDDTVYGAVRDGTSYSYTNPQIVVEGIADDVLCCICTDTGTIVDPTTGQVTLGDMIVKNYCDAMHCSGS